MKKYAAGRLAVAAGLAAMSASSIMATAVAGAPQAVTVPLNSHVQTGYAVSDSYQQTMPGEYYNTAAAPGFPYAGDIYGSAYGVANDGWQMPGRAPVDRLQVQYLRYYPQRWYGTPGSALPQVAPQVYMPTDTTQLGFYYQRVPTWQPVPGMLPPPPNPAMLHSYGVYGYGFNGYGTVDQNYTTSSVPYAETQPVSTSVPMNSLPSQSQELRKAMGLPLMPANDATSRPTMSPSSRNIVPPPAPPG